MKPIDKIQEYFGLADIDYLSARLLILNGLPTVGLAKGAEAMEKQLKLFIAMFERIKNGKELTVRDFKKFGHGLLNLLKEYNERAPQRLNLNQDWEKLFKLLQDAYDKRHPEHWKEWEMRVSIHEIDQAYTYFRNLNLSNTPEEFSQRALDFGTFVGDLWQNEEYYQRIIDMGLKSPFELLKLENRSYANLKISNKK